MQEEKIPRQPGDDMNDPAMLQRRANFFIRFAASLTIWLRRYGGGSDSPGMPGVLALLALFSWAYASHNLLCLWYAEASVVLFVIYRLTMDRTSHSRYEGRPYLKLLFRNEALASAMEPVALIGLGYWLYERIPVFGVLFLVSGVGCAAGELVEWHQRRRMLIEFRDGQRMMEYQRALYKRAGR